MSSEGNNKLTDCREERKTQASSLCDLRHHHRCSVDTHRTLQRARRLILASGVVRKSPVDAFYIPSHLTSYQQVHLLSSHGKTEVQLYNLFITPRGNISTRNIHFFPFIEVFIAKEFPYTDHRIL